MGNVYIFGAHSRARTLKEYLEETDPDMCVQAFLVDNDEPNPKSADGAPVVNLAESGSGAVGGLDRENTVYLGIRGINQCAVKERLLQIGFRDIIPVTVELDTELRNRYLEKHFGERGEPLLKIDAFKLKFAERDDRSSSVTLYVVSSIYDSVPEEKHVFKPVEKTIQVGCAISDKRLQDAIYDDAGDNISEWNAQFCELTAHYWIWKNSKQGIVGVEHYRRFFELPDDWESVMLQNHIDVILPVPLYVAPNLRENYCSRHAVKPWDDMMQVLAQLYPEDYAAAQVYFEQALYSPCNMIIAVKPVYDRLCEWLFPILFEVVARNGELDDRYQNRYPGFLAERLMSFYFDRHKAEVKLVYADKVFLR